ncbi:MAG: hypothetical protein HC922_08250 [Leptolyngbyaceae cyanobacterium SM2_3_12]|nr:hypothetical protein [Leptolyngbyaceae cyanobacterium SM2_3_12]
MTTLACSPMESPEPSLETLPSSNFGMQPGQYCYRLATDTQTGVIRLTLDENQEIIGDSRFTIHHAEASYYSAYAQKLEGLLYQDELAVNITTWIEYDVQKTEENLDPWPRHPDHSV